MTLLPLPPTIDDDEASRRTLLHLLSEGRVAAVRAQVADRSPDDLFAELLDADARLRVLDITVADVVELRRRVEAEAPPGSPLHHWAQALVCERLVLELDGVGVLLAFQALGEITEEPLPPLITLYSRARLGRMAACAFLVLPDDEARIAGQGRRDAAVLDLLRCGFTAEAAWTRGIAAGVQATMHADDLRRDLAVMRGARRLLHDGSVWPVLLDWVFALAAFQSGELADAHAAADRVERARFDHPLLARLPVLIRSMSALIASGGADDAVAVVEDVLHEIGSVSPRMMQGFQGAVAGVLADLGSPHALRMGWLALDLPSIRPTQALDDRVLRWRLAVLEGQPVAAEELQEVLDDLEAAGRRRHASIYALRGAHDLMRVRRVEDATRLHRWGTERLVPVRDRAVWEFVWARPLASTAPAPSLPAAPPAPRLEVRLLAPSLEVAVDGRAVALTGHAARLVVVLARHHPAPVHIEQVADTLWPDGAPGQARARLNTVVHRLRRLLGAAEDRLVRQGDLLSFAADDVVIDVTELERALAGPADGQAEALAGVRGNLCEAQFPYDEALIDARHRFAGRWLDRARAVLAADATARARLAPAADAVGVPLPPVGAHRP